MSTISNGICSLLDRFPNPSVAEVLAQLVPPREFENARFDTYRPDPSFPSQQAALEAGKNFVHGSDSAKKLFSKASKSPAAVGIYLDGGFGVGKTHLLASIWHEFKGKKAFGSFLAYTSLIGLLGFNNAVSELSRFQLICIDEFELDDPGDTMLMSRLLTELGSKGIRFAATSNTPPNALGEGRFAARDFTREISAMANSFTIVSVDGEDYRHRPVDGHSTALAEPELELAIASRLSSGKNVARDDFDSLLKHLSKVHPSKYLKLIEDIDVLVVDGAHVLKDQAAALRFVSLVDRLYESQVELMASGLGLTEVFSDEYLSGGYRKKYLRAISRIGSLTSGS